MAAAPNCDRRPLARAVFTAVTTSATRRAGDHRRPAVEAAVPDPALLVVAGVRRAEHLPPERGVVELELPSTTVTTQLSHAGP